MIKYEPSIMIWRLKISDKEDGTIYDNFYFLSYRRAKKFWKKYEAVLKDFNVALGGEQLWLW